MLLAVVWYYFPKYGGVYWFKGPIPTVADNTDKKSKPESVNSVADDKTSSLRGE